MNFHKFLQNGQVLALSLIILSYSLPAFSENQLIVDSKELCEKLSVDVPPTETPLNSIPKTMTEAEKKMVSNLKSICTGATAAQALNQLESMLINLKDNSDCSLSALIIDAEGTALGLDEISMDEAIDFSEASLDIGLKRRTDHHRLEVRVPVHSLVCPIFTS